MMGYVFAVDDASLVWAVDLHGIEGDEHNVADQASHIEGDG